jgi:hypothetical protein
MLDFRLNEVIGDAWHDLQESAACYGSNAFDLSMVIDDELNMRHKCSEAPPAGERLRVDHKAGEFPLRRNEWIDLFRQLLEVRFLKRPIRSNNYDVSVAQQFKS